jgi:sugar lactone lactonase YvrE
VVAARPGLHPSGLGWSLDGTLLIVAVLDLQLIAAEEGELHTFADLSVAATSFTNDMAVDAKGRAYIGQAGSNIAAGEAIVAAPLVRVDPDGSVHDVGGELMCANGIVVADNGRTLLVAETFANRITAFDIDAMGDLHDQRVWAELPEGHGPDGICLDVAGGVWAACPFVERFVRVLEGGAITDEIAVTGRRAIACTLGGEAGTTLFLITWEATAESPLVTSDRTSRIEWVEVSIPSAGQP